MQSSTEARAINGGQPATVADTKLGTIFKILLVEDTLSQTALVKRLLGKSERAKFAITSVRSLAEAIESVGASVFDVILLDLGLPDSKGLNTLVRMYECASATPIVVFTADSEESLGMELIRRGAQDYVEKDGVNSASLVRAITYAVERRKLADKLIETQKIFVAFMENNPAAAFVVTEGGEKLYSNEQFERSFTSRETSKANSPDEIVRQTRHEDLRVLRAGNPIETIEKVADLQGRTKNWLVVKFPFADVNGRRLIGGTAVDVTELERSREAVRQTREMFQVLFYHSHIPQAIVGPDFRFRRVNRAYCDLLKYSEEELLSKQLSDVTSPDDWHTARQLLLTPSQLHRSQTKLIDKLGRQIKIDRVGTVILDAADSPLFAAIVDYGEAIQPAEQSPLSASQSILQSSPFPAFVLNQSGKIVACNQALCQMFGFRDEATLRDFAADHFQILETTTAASPVAMASSLELWKVSHATAHGEILHRHWKISTWAPPGETATAIRVVVGDYLEPER